MSKKHLRKALDDILKAALEAVDPFRAVQESMRLLGEVLHIGGCEYPVSRFRKIYLVGAGKAAGPMARAVEATLGHRLCQGLIVVPQNGPPSSLARTEVLQSSHPIPDEAGARAAEHLVSFVDENLTPEDLLIVVISGGASALLPAPIPPITLAEKQRATRTLLVSGATIQELNTIRKHLSRIKGGRLIRHTSGCRIVSLILSDVVGDDLAAIASGPTAADPTTFEDCLAIVRSYGIADELPVSVMGHLCAGASGTGFQGRTPEETVKPGDPCLRNVQNLIVASNRKALQAAAGAARKAGYTPLILTSSLYGDVTELGRFFASIARESLASGNPVKPPCCIISGGEPTVRVRGSGKGGRNQELVLRFLFETSDWGDVPVLFASVGSDGIDGPTEAAGAWVQPRDSDQASRQKLSIRRHLEENDSFHFHQGMDRLIVTGQTETNVMDLQILLIQQQES